MSAICVSGRISTLVCRYLNAHYSGIDCYECIALRERPKAQSYQAVDFDALQTYWKLSQLSSSLGILQLSYILTPCLMLKTLEQPLGN